MLMALRNRLLRILLELLILLDTVVGLALAIPFYLILGHPVPDTNETISSVVGRYATAGWKWALVSEKIIDWMFYVATGVRGHCRYAYMRVKRFQEG